MSFSRGSSPPMDRTCITCLWLWQAGSLPLMPPGKPKDTHTAHAGRMQPEGLKVFSCNYATNSDHHHVLLNKHLHFLPAPIIILDK